MKRSGCNIISVLALTHCWRLFEEIKPCIIVEGQKDLKSTGRGYSFYIYLFFSCFFKQSTLEKIQWKLTSWRRRRKRALFFLLSKVAQPSHLPCCPLSDKPRETGDSKATIVPSATSHLQMVDVRPLHVTLGRF